MNHGAVRHVQTMQLWARKPLCSYRSTIPRRVHLNSRRSSTSPECKVVFSGIQPTGVPHLGNYLGALQQWVALQDEARSSTELIFSIVDLHAITVQQNSKHLRQWKRETLAALLAVGLDPERSTIFYQSAVAEHTELMWILSCLAPVGQLSRMTQWKSKLSVPDHSRALEAGAAKEKLKLGLFSYPVLQAADILLYGATHVPVGEDQVQHLEFTRHCADAFNSVYGNALIKPDIVLCKDITKSTIDALTILHLARSPRVMSLREPNQKMSKSDPDHRSRIHINDSVSDIQMKVRLALTDSLPNVQYDPSLRPGVSNLLELLSHFDGKGLDVHELAQLYHTTTMRQFKDTVAMAIADDLSRIRYKYEQLLNFSNACYLEDIAAVGAIKAKEKARDTISRVRCSQGLAG